MFTDFRIPFLNGGLKRTLAHLRGKLSAMLLCGILMTIFTSCTETSTPSASTPPTSTAATSTAATVAERPGTQGTSASEEGVSTTSAQQVQAPTRIVEVTTAATSTSSTSTANPVSSTETGQDSLSEEQLEKIVRMRPNELGELLIVLYHHIGGEDSLYYRSVTSFKKDLQTLYDKGYRLISIEDYINSNYDIPAGTTPVVLTFDDGARSHFEVAFDAEGNPYPHPDCAVGILDAFYKEHPDFGRHAVFYINGGAFHQPAHLEWKLKYLYENGYEIGNHTLNHAALDTLDGEGIQRELGKNESFYRRIFSDLRMTSVAYPFGNRPRSEHGHLVLNGQYEGETYEYQIGIIAGWCPTKPLYSRKMHPLEVYRVQGGVNAQQLDWWLALLDREPQRRFISDGIPGMIFVPESLEAELDRELVGEDRIFLYKDR